MSPQGRDATDAMILSDTAVAVVLFRPSEAQTDRIAERFAGQVPGVFVFDNGGTSEETIDRLLSVPGLRYLAQGGNVGIAAALNAVVAAAREAGFRYLLLLDQDADAGIETLKGLRAAMLRLALRPDPVAVVGPAPAPTRESKAPHYPARPGVAALGPLQPVEFLATSGSLLDLAVFDLVGAFRADYFIDAVELEWCFRAWARGLTCWMDTETVIAHSVGRGVIRGRLLPVAMPRQVPFRMATYVRNTVYGWRLAHIPGRWKRRQMLYLPVQIWLYWADSRFRPAILARLVAAAFQGLAGRLGRPADAPP